MQRSKMQIINNQLIGILLLFCSALVASDKMDLSHNRMLRELRSVHDQTLGNNPYQGTAEVERLRDELSRLPETASIQSRVSLNFDLGVAELFQGNESQAIMRLLEADRLLENKSPSIDFRNIVRMRLALAYLRLGETQNCCLHNNPNSCLLPIMEGGVHVDQAGSRQAIVQLENILNSALKTESRLQLEAKWLLNVAYMTVGEYPSGVPPQYLIPPTAFDSEVEFPRFTNIASILGVGTFSLSGGAVADDFDNDGLLDLVVSSSDVEGQLKFLRNDVSGVFLDRTEKAQLTGIVGGLNLIQADYDNDGWLDVLVLRGGWFAQSGRHPNSLLQNMTGINAGEILFRDVTFLAGMGDFHYPTQTGAWGDYDNDGDVDVYIGNESTDWQISPSQLFRNEGDGAFVEVAEEAGVINDRFTKAVVWGDYDEDGFADLYISNLGSANRMYRNNVDGTFVDVASDVGVAGPTYSFPSWFWDFDNDGHLDLYVASYEASIAHVAASYLELPFRAELSRLYRGDGLGGFVDVARSSNLVRPTKAMGANFGDLDNDGYCDFYLGTGDTDYGELMPNLMFLNVGGEKFVDVTTAGGFGHLQKGHGVAFADFDNDGDQDIFEQMGGAYKGDGFLDSFYENPGFGNRWLSVRLTGILSNRAGIGARIRVDVNDNNVPRTIYKHVNSGGSFGANPLRQTIGLGTATRIERLVVYWPVSGEEQSFVNVPLDVFLDIEEGNPTYKIYEPPRVKFGG